MADLPDSVGIFDDFTDAKKMSSTTCQQVSLEEYEGDISSETDKALGDLCMYLDKHPDVYARILRKRKQEDLENDGLISFVKSKMMKLVHGEEYPECLLSISECIQQTNDLKTGICKTFQYSQEIKGTPNRYSKRLAAKHNQLVKKQAVKTSQIDDVHTNQTTDTSASHEKDGQNYQDKSCPNPPPPPPPPPPPVLMVTTQNILNVSRKTLSSMALKVEALSAGARRRSPRVGKTKGGYRGENLMNCKDSSSFLTPMVTRTRSLKKSLSNSSVSSVSSRESLRSINSEILCSNPINRLKVTQVVRSPGGTPVRPNVYGQMPTEPLHKALVNALMTKFKNVHSPSPCSGDVSLNASHTGNDSLNTSNTGHGLLNTGNTDHGLLSTNTTGNDSLNTSNTGNGLLNASNTGHGLLNTSNTGHGLLNTSNTGNGLLNTSNTGNGLLNTSNTSHGSLYTSTTSSLNTSCTGNSPMA